ncbi:hypothetical protein GCM10010358_78600 [Streptomyces minutiscleroticus]|uniref:Alpha-glucosidase n=1 Tax=Streptomyces minutiscleroticus TaxID=68238 RepID=A0A918UA31_9ACTN|nr:hypothetical protein GCM10010358_78600 [Streptomyces minutiscleroticus]
MRRVLLQDVQSGQHRPGGEKEGGEARVRPAGQLPRLRLARGRERGQLKGTVGAAGQQQLTGGGQDPAYFRGAGQDGFRDGCRVPIPWTREGSSYGFGDGGSRLPQPAEWAELSVEAQTGVPG